MLIDTNPSWFFHPSAKDDVIKYAFWKNGVLQGNGNGKYFTSGNCFVTVTFFYQFDQVTLLTLPESKYKQTYLDAHKEWTTNGGNSWANKRK